MVYWFILCNFPVTLIDWRWIFPASFFTLSHCCFFRSCMIHLLSLPGSENLQCDVEGMCGCRVGVTGEKCDTCRAGFHSLGPGGCRWATIIVVNTHVQTQNCYKIRILEKRGLKQMSDGYNYIQIDNIFFQNPSLFVPFSLPSKTFLTSNYKTNVNKRIYISLCDTTVNQWPSYQWAAGCAKYSIKLLITVLTRQLTQRSLIFPVEPWTDVFVF